MSWLRALGMRCDEATRLASDGLDRALTGVESTGVRLHRVSCRSCRRVNGQFWAMRAANELMRAGAAGGTRGVARQMPPALRRRLEGRLGG